MAQFIQVFDWKRFQVAGGVRDTSKKLHGNAALIPVNSDAGQTIMGLKDGGWILVEGQVVEFSLNIKGWMVAGQDTSTLEKTGAAWSQWGPHTALVCPGSQEWDLHLHEEFPKGYAFVRQARREGGHIFKSTIQIAKSVGLDTPAGRLCWGLMFASLPSGSRMWYGDTEIFPRQPMTFEALFA